MRLIFWVTALAVLSISTAKNSTAKAKPKRQLDSIRTHENLQYSLVLPHSRVAHFRSLPNTRRISHAIKGGKLPPYAVQMEPVVQYSQKDPLYDPTHDNVEDPIVNKNEIHAQSKILNVGESPESYGPPYGTLPTAPLYSHHPHYYEAPEPIIEIIIKESNESLPAPPPAPVQKKKKEPVHVFYVKYSKDPHSKDKVIYEKPIPAITPSSNDDDDHHDEYITVTPEPYIPQRTTTLRAIIKPESEVYHSDSSVKVTFGNEGRHYSDRREGNSHSEDHEETAPKPAIAYPNQPLEPTHPSLEHSVSRPQYQENGARSIIQQGDESFKISSHSNVQNRVQFQPQPQYSDQQLPRQGPSVSPFRSQSQTLNSFGPTPIFNGAFSNGPVIPSPHFGGPTIPSPTGPSFPRPNYAQNFQSRVNPSPTFAPRPQFNGPPRTSFHSGPQRPFHSQSKPTYVDDPKYLQENYHTITTEQVDPPKHQLLPYRQPSTFNPVPQPSPNPNAAQFQEHRRPQLPLSQQLPQQRQHQHFTETSKPILTANPSSSPFFNLRPSPPHIESNRPPFQQNAYQQQSQQQFGFHQGPPGLPRPSNQVPNQQTTQQHSFLGPISPSPSPIPQTQFIPQPSSAPLFNFHPQPSPTPDVFHHQSSSSERPQFQQSHRPSDRPNNNEYSFHSQENLQHRQNIGSVVPNGGELVPSISKYEQHITVNGPTSTPFNGFSESSPSLSTPTSSQPEQQYQHLQHHHQIHQHYQQQQQQQQQKQQQQQQQQQQQHQQQQQNQQLQQHQQQQQQQQQQEQAQQQHEIDQQEQQQYHQQQQDAEQEQVRLQLAHNVKKQQEEIQRLQAQLLYTHQQQQQQLQENYNQQIQATSSRPQYIQERSRPQNNFVSSTSSPAYYQSTSRTVEIKPSTQKYVSSTEKSVSTTSEPKKEVNKNKPSIELPDEVPDDLREQLLSSGILDNADISVLDYDKVGETPLDSLPPDQLANFFSAGGAQQISASENQPVYVRPNGDQIESRIDEDIDDDQDFAASENVPSYVVPPPDQKQAVEMKVVHFNPETQEGQNLANEYIKENATQVEPVALNDKTYNRYLPLKVRGNQFPLPDILKGRKITSVVVLAPVETEALKSNSRTKRSASEDLKGIKFIAGKSLQDLLKRPTKDNFEKWLDVEKKTATDLQSVVLLVTGNDEAADQREIFMYDIATGNVNKLSGELSNAFVEAAENNSLSKDIESLAIKSEGIPENFNKDPNEEIAADGSENVPLFVDLSGLSLNQENNNHLSISSGYSKTKLGRSLRPHS